jgi:hypothetical protein
MIVTIAVNNKSFLQFKGDFITGPDNPPLNNGQVLSAKYHTLQHANKVPIRMLSTDVITRKIKNRLYITLKKEIARVLREEGIKLRLDGSGSQKQNAIWVVVNTSDKSPSLGEIKVTLQLDGWYTQDLSRFGGVKQERWKNFDGRNKFLVKLLTDTVNNWKGNTMLTHGIACPFYNPKGLTLGE